MTSQIESFFAKNSLHNTKTSQNEFKIKLWRLLCIRLPFPPTSTRTPTQTQTKNGNSTMCSSASACPPKTKYDARCLGPGTWDCQVSFYGALLLNNHTQSLNVVLTSNVFFGGMVALPYLSNGLLGYLGNLPSVIPKFTLFLASCLIRYFKLYFTFLRNCLA